MNCKCILILSLVTIVSGAPIIVENSIEEDGYDGYDGLLAPLNADGSVAFTKEYERIRDEHLAAHEREYQKTKEYIDELEREGQSGQQQQQQQPQQQQEGQYDPEVYERVPYVSAEEDDGQYDPVVHEEKYHGQYDDGNYKPRYSKEEESEEEDYSDLPNPENASYESEEE